MKIGIISSGHEVLPLFHFLHQYDHEYHIFCDWQYWPWGDKSKELVGERTRFGREYLIKQGVDAVITSPVEEVVSYELGVNVKIVPLFTTYLNEYCLKYSIVGKLGLLCDQADMGVAQELIGQMTEAYELSEHQKKTKDFHQDFPIWQKEVRMRKYFLTTYSKNDWMVRKTIKTDLRYFRDADVDTLIPMSRGMFHYAQMIKQWTNRKRLRFHGLDALEQSFRACLPVDSSSSYGVTVYATDQGVQMLVSEKKRQRLLSRGQSIDIKSVRV